MKPVYQGDIILAGFEHLLRSGLKDTKLIMFASGYDIPVEVDKRARKLAAEFEDFHYQTELLPRTEVCELWSQVDVFISAPVYDGYSNAVGEGRYMGAVPVVNAIPANLELIRHQENGWVVDPFTPLNLAEDLQTILNELEQYKAAFAPVNRAWMLEHSMLEKNIAEFITDCEKLLRGSAKF